MDNSFSKEIIDILFNIDQNNCLLSTETYDVEYKLNYNISQELFNFAVIIILFNARTVLCFLHMIMIMKLINHISA